MTEVMKETVYQAMLAKARATDRTRCVDERRAGLGTPSDGGLFMLLWTAQSALECAVKTQDWQIACEGIVFLEQALASFARASRQRQ